VDTAKQLAEATLSELLSSGAKRLLVFSPGDYFTFNQLYTERLGLDFPENIELVELTTLLADRLEGGEIRFNQLTNSVPYAYVDPTQSVRVPDRHSAPRDLLAAAMASPACELFWRRERAHPVGSTALQFTKPDVAEKLTLARLEDAKRSGAELLLCDDPGTMKKIDEFAGDFDLRARGLYEFLVDQLA
jgi:Fe-S oxidoreductase